MGSSKPLRKAVQERPRTANRDYRKFRQIDGTHSFKKAVPTGFVDYAVHKRPNGKVAYFNFELAKEMGLIPRSHEHQLNRNLCQMLLETFALQIVNEYDLIHKTPIPKKDLKPNKYMATRYLQLQHPNKKGTTSGDGRGIWNGEFSANGVTWDVSSCGTGATCLSPATAIEKRFFKTGDTEVSYGCGYADLSDGIGAAVMSEIFHKNGIQTERTLAVIEFPGDLSINVRANRCLLRPSHFFHHLKQGHLERLRASVDYFIDRQISNGDFPRLKRGQNRYDLMADEIAKTFARIAAKYESDYIFCWLDWDGDNILANGGIIDYGSVRQFGLYHHEYRYDDVQRWSTNIPEQSKKSRYLVQTFAQIRDYLKTGKKKNLKDHANDSLLKKFDRHIEQFRNQFLMEKIGFNSKQVQFLMKHHEAEARSFRSSFSYFEKAKSSKGKYKVPDGVTWDAIYCMRDILRELPMEYMGRGRQVSSEIFLKTLVSSYATKKDRQLTSAKQKKIQEFQRRYNRLLDLVQKKFKLSERRLLLEITMRSSVINRYDRITGEAILCVTERLMKERKDKTVKRLNQMILDFIEYQDLRPAPQTKYDSVEKLKSDKIMNRILKLVVETRESI